MVYIEYIYIHYVSADKMAKPRLFAAKKCLKRKEERFKLIHISPIVQQNK